MSKPWGGVDASALDAERAEEEEREQVAAFPPPSRPRPPASPASARRAARRTTPRRRTRAPYSRSPTSTASRRLRVAPVKPRGLTPEEMMMLPTGPPELSAEELDRSRVFRSYGGDGPGGGEGRRGFNEKGRRGPAGEVFHWGPTTKKFTPAAAASDRRDRFGGPYYPLGRRADEIDDAIVLYPPKRDPSATTRTPPAEAACNRPSPFGDARPREDVLAEKGLLHWRKIESEIKHMRHDGSPIRRVSDNSEASQLPKDSTSVLQNEKKVRSRGQVLPIISRPQEAQLWLFSDRKEPPLKSAQAAAAQSARDGEDDAAAAVAAAAGKIPELQAENLPEAKEAKQHLPPPRNHCQPILKGAPFIVCSTCLKLVQMPADFAISTDTVRKLRCGSCWAVLSYSYRDPGRKKPCDGSIDQLSTDMSELQVDAAPLLLEVLEELGAPRGGNFRG
ncbi:unnamed protein product [Urochloa humidicola]